MTETAELEIGLHRQDSGLYSIEFRFSQPNSDAEVRVGQGQPTQAAFDLEGLNQLAYDPSTYGEKLTESFFSEPIVRTTFSQVRAVAQTLGVPLRMRLMIGPSAMELHKLHWESLCDPQDGRPLATSENILFSRYLSSLDWRQVRLRSRGDLHALVLVANPINLPDYKLAPIDVQGELNRVKQGLGDLQVNTIPDSGSGQRATLNSLFENLRSCEVDILYLVCHGTFLRGESWLWLENEQGEVERVSGDELVTRIQELDRRPRLVVLASCDSAGDGSGEALAALGPSLAEAGIPAVLAMQGKVTIQTVTEFMPLFFRELMRDGQIDRALAVARGAVRHRPDYWIPALFMRLKSGRIWYVPGFSDEANEFEKWESLAGFVREETCTPILGPGLIEQILGTRRDMAVNWAEKHGFPLDPNDRIVLPRVAQYMAIHQSPAYIPVALREALREEILRRYHGYVPRDLAQANPWSTSQMLQAIQLATDQYWSEHPEDPYWMLAQLRLPIYIQTGVLDLMSLALTKAGAEPVVRICPWNKWIPEEKALYEDTPTAERPLVYHLFGHISVPNSVVYSEDRYFDYLIGMTLNKSLIPSVVRAALNSTSLLFLGFQIEDWEFRVFFRFLLAQEGRELLKFYSHAAAQIEPEEDRILDLHRARQYFEEYFEHENIAIYWGSTEEFLKALHQHI